MNKEKFQLEYIFENVSKKSLWNHLTTTNGLSAWFADKVEIKDDIYTFYWDKTFEKATLLLAKNGVSARYRWEEDDESVYFEFIIHTLELTGATALEIIDFSEPQEKEDAIDLWETQIEALKRTLGI